MDTYFQFEQSKCINIFAQVTYFLSHENQLTVPVPINGASTIRKIFFRKEVGQLNRSASNSKNNFWWKFKIVELHVYFWNNISLRILIDLSLLKTVDLALHKFPLIIQVLPHWLLVHCPTFLILIQRHLLLVLKISVVSFYLCTRWDTDAHFQMARRLFKSGYYLKNIFFLSFLRLLIESGS